MTYFMKLSIVPFCLLLGLQSNAQNLHADVFAGISTYQGDLEAKKVSMNFAKPAIGLGASYDITSRLIGRAGFSFGKVSASDKSNTNSKPILDRNLNFSTSIAEFHLALEFNFLDLSEHSLSPYIFAGVAGFHFNPYTETPSSNKVFLQPLSTEGQGLSQYPDRKPYKLTQMAIPFGGGLKFEFSDNIQIAAEVGLRKLFTDYLDDVSTYYVDQATLLAAKGPLAVDLAYRGDELSGGAPYPPAGTIRGGSKYKDWYTFSGLRLSYRLGNNSSNNKGGKNKMGCPTTIY
ncbi:MAG: DUF6089 family protein [Chitinophagaceae bacterium]